MTVQFKSQHILALSVVLSTAQNLAWAGPAEDVSSTEQKLKSTVPTATATQQRLVPATPTQQRLLPASAAQQSLTQAPAAAGPPALAPGIPLAKPVLSGAKASEARLRNDPDFASIISKISMVGWNPGPTMIYKDAAVPAAANATAGSNAFDLAGMKPNALANGTAGVGIFDITPSAASNKTAGTATTSSAPAAAAAGSQLKGNAAVSAVSSQFQTLPFANLNGAESDRTQILQEFRCTGVVTRSYQRGQRRILVEAFRFPTSDGAYGAYYLLRHGASTVIKRGDASSEDDQSISFWKDRFYIHVYGTSEDDSESKDAVRGIADQLAAAIVAEPASVPPMISRLPSLEKVRGSEKLVMGPISARRFFPAPYINTLQLGNALGAAVADYQMQFPYPERLKLLYVEYNNANAASSAFYDYTGNLQSTNKGASGDRDPLEEAGGLPTSCLFKVMGGYMLCELRGQELILISGARKKTSPIMLARQVY